MLNKPKKKPLFDPITWEEFELISAHFTTKAAVLRDKVKKPFAWLGYDISKYSKILMDNNQYVIAAGNVFTEIINNVLPKAIELYPASFGVSDPTKVLRAIYDTEPWGPFERFDTFLSLEQFAFVFELDSKITVKNEVLRLDLFRILNASGNAGRKPEFTGGLFHAFKHFNYKGIPLSTGAGEIELHHPRDIITFLSNCFFKANKQPTASGFNSMMEFSSLKLKAVFYEERDTDIYFLKTLHPTQ